MVSNIQDGFGVFIGIIEDTILHFEEIVTLSFLLQIFLLEVNHQIQIFYIISYEKLFELRLFFIKKGFFNIRRKAWLILVYIILIINPSMTLKYIIIFALVSFILAAECHGQPGPRSINLNPIWRGEPQLIKVHKYGKLYEIGNEATKMKMIHVYGDMYQMGYAHGSLLKQQINKMIYDVWDYLKGQFEDILPKKFPAFLKKPTSGLLVAAALDLTYQITYPFTNKKYYEQMRGISDASGVPLKLFKRIHMIGELTKGTCSMFGAWGKATADTNLIQLRALDWDVDGPFWKYPLITVYHPSSKKFGNSWLNVGFYGWVGVISGVNQHRLGMSQIGIYFRDQTFGKESRFGNPFTFVIRDILQWDTTLNDSINRLKTTKRTCDLLLGVGDGKSNQFRAFQYSHSVLNVINDTHLMPKNDTWHAAIENVVYYAMDWLCPSYNLRLNQLINQHYGNITVQNTISHIMPGVNSGNLQAVVYDLAHEWIYFTYGIINANKKIVNAYERPFIGLNLKSIFSEPAPKI